MNRDRSSQATWLALVAITAIGLYLCWQMLQPFVDVLIWAGVLVIVFYPAHRWIVERTARPGLSALLSVALVLTTVIVPLVFAATAMVRELTAFAASAQTSVQVLLANPPQNERLLRVLELVQRRVDLQDVLSPENIRNVATRASQVAVQGTVGVVGGALGFLVKAFFAVFTMFYLFRDAQAIVAHLSGLLPLDKARTSLLVTRTQEVISASVTGVLVIAAIQGTLGGLMFWFLGLTSPFLWGVIMTLLSMIPLVGPALVWAPAALFLAIGGSWVKAIVLTTWGIFVIGLVDNVLRPRLVGEKTQMHPLVIFFSVLGGLQVFGVLGLLLGPVVLAITLALLAVFREAQPPRVVNVTAE
jgi:predicted PurR-regulated permease PerM